MTAPASPTASTTSAHTSALSHLTKTIFTPGHDFLMMMALVLIFLMLWMPATREILKGIIGTLLIPAFSAVFLTTFRWMTK
ncbi:MAG: hypothetical protein PHX24_13335, partial [Acidithiobacillus sp.]|nr:hypothetical protein [Acidithiobacillus sp.]